MSDERKNNESDNESDEGFRFNVNDLTIDGILGMTVKDRAHVYEHLGLEHSAKTTPKRGIFKYWNIGQCNENTNTSKIKIMSAIDKAKSNVVDDQRGEIFTAIQAMTATFTGVAIEQKGTVLSLTITDHAAALAYVRQAEGLALARGAVAMITNRPTDNQASEVEQPPVRRSSRQVIR